MVAVQFDVALMSVVTVATQRLPVGPVEKEGSVPFMALDVIDHGGLFRVVVSAAQLTERVFS